MSISKSTEFGNINISLDAIASLAGGVVTECYGVVGMASRNKKDGIVNLLKPDSMTKGISITVEEGGVIVEIHLIVEYGININTICKSIVNRVRYTIENTVGIKVNRINVRVEGVRVD